MASAIQLRVIKLGGSLLDWLEWPAALRRWLSNQPQARNILIAGGGALADEIRRRDDAEHLDPSTAHWLAIDAMSANIAAVRRLLREAIPADRSEELDTPIASGALIALCPRDFLKRIEPNSAGERLPHSWDVTSDSIAARLAEFIGAQELVLLKSTLPPRITTLHQAADIGYVDRCFPRFAGRLPSIRCCNLRHDQLAEWVAR